MDASDPTNRPEPNAAGRSMLEINEGELCRIILDIHDGPVQNMYAALSQINALQRRLAHRSSPSPDDAAVDAGLAQVAGLLESSLGEIRDFIGTFRPPEFQKRDLLTVVEGLIVQHENLTGSRVDLEVDGALPSPSVPAKIGLYRILQEALSNGYRHSGADHQTVRLAGRDAGILMEVCDEGSGFDVRTMLDPRGDGAPHIGLRGMQHRVELLGGTFRIDSQVGHGTRLTVWVPSHD